MADSNKASSESGGRKILVIYSGHKPERIVDLLASAGCKVDDIVFAVPTEIASGKIDPSCFDDVIAVLSDDLAGTPDLGSSALVVAQCGAALTGIWPEGTEAGVSHPIMAQYGKAQVPWNSNDVRGALQNKPQALQTSSGVAAPSISITQNRC